MTDKEVTRCIEKARVFARDAYGWGRFDGFSEDEVYKGAAVFLIAARILDDSHDEPEKSAEYTDLCNRLEMAGLLGDWERTGQIYDLLVKEVRGILKMNDTQKGEV